MGAEVTVQDATGARLNDADAKHRTALLCLSYHYRDRDGNRVELQIENFEIPSGG